MNEWKERMGVFVCGGGGVDEWEERTVYLL